MKMQFNETHSQFFPTHPCDEKSNQLLTSWNESNMSCDLQSTRLEGECENVIQIISSLASAARVWITVPGRVSWNNRVTFNIYHQSIHHNVIQINIWYRAHTHTHTHAQMMIGRWCFNSIELIGETLIASSVCVLDQISVVHSIHFIHHRITPDQHLVQL